MSTRLPGPDLRDLVAIPKFLGPRNTAVHPVSGVTIDGAPVIHVLGEGWTLLVFLSTTCDGCKDLWDALGDPDGSAFPDDLTRLVVVPLSTDPTAVAEVSGRAAVVLSEDAWADYGVHSGPFFVLVEGGRSIATEGVAWSVEQIVGAISAARRT